ncbi:MAG: right-handed parallel beta-helix repeat-containing protein [Promethearchaeota archaeon]
MRSPFERHLSIELTSNLNQNPIQTISTSTTSSNQPHAPIRILNNSDFSVQAMEENWPGDGSSQHPYVIEGLEISGAFNLIEIHDTSVYFQINSCSLTHGRVGVSLYHVTNGFLFNNTIFDCYEIGISLQSSGNCTFANNSIVANSLGFYMSSCSDNLIQYNYISANPQGGIFSTDLTNCTIFSNHITHTSNGIFIEFFYGVQILDNLIENNYEGIRIQRNEILYRHWNGHEYRLIRSDKRWIEAKLDCEARGGHLVTITSSVENTLVTGLAQMGSIWIGLTDEIIEGEWQWVTGETVNYTNWNLGEPNDAGGEDYVEMYDYGEWNDLPSDNTLPYVCEWDYYVISDEPLTTVISGNQIINHTGRGIYALEVQNIQISDNLMINNSYYGLELRYSNFCNITQNQVKGGGIHFYGSGSNQIVNNSVSRHGFKIDAWESAHYEQIAVVNNSVNGKPFIYWQSISDQVISEAGQVILIECNNITIGNQNISFTLSGIMGYDCTNVTITNNIFNNNSEYAVWFRNSVNCMISNNEMRYNDQGLRIDMGMDFSINNNTIKGSFSDGISLDYSEQAVLTKNTIRNNGGGGIRLYRSDYCRLTNNTIVNNEGTGIYVRSSYTNLTNNLVINNSDQGIHIADSGNNIVKNNTLVNNSFLITGWKYEHYIQAEIVNNTINSKQIVYWLYVNGKTVPFGAGLVILVGCDSITIENQQLFGILGVYCTNVSIHHNVISQGSNGIQLWDSDLCSITNNTIINNSGTGIELRDSPDNLLVNNTVTNNEDGINLDSSQRSILANNTVTMNTWNGIQLQSSRNSSLTNNSVIINGGTGILLVDSSNSILNANSVINNSGEGIHIYRSWDNLIINNLLVNNSFSLSGWEYGHYIQTEFENNTLNDKPIVYWWHMTGTVPSGAAYVILVDCTLVTVVNQNVFGIIGANCENLTIQRNIISNGSQGILLCGSDGSLISGNTITSVDGTGIEIDDSQECILINNTIINNRGGGIEFWNSRGTNLTNNTINNNSDVGIYFGDSDGTILVNNTISSNSEGIWSWESWECVLANNHITNNERTGIYQRHSEFCTFSGNFITQNGEEGVLLDDSHFNTLTQNWIVNNEGSGLVIGDYGWDWWYYYGSSSNDCVVVNNTISRNGDVGIIIQFSEYCVLMNNSVESNNNTGILLKDSRHCALYSNNITNNSVIGIQVVASSLNNLFSGNIIAKHKYYGIFIQLGENNTVSYNNFYGNNPGNSSQAYDDGWLNIFTHNFWNDWISPDANGDGVVDVAYFIAGGVNNHDQSPATIQNHLILGVLLSPRYEEPLSGIVLIEWVAVDLLDHNITYSIFYSMDGGEKWILIATGLAVPFYNWDTTTVVDGSHYYLQIIANCSEGASCVFSSKVPFTIDNGRHIHPFSITSPETGDIIIGTIEIHWTVGEDVFDHQVHYTVSISPDNGQAWIVIESYTIDLSCFWDSTTFPDGSQYIIQVTAICTEGSVQVASRGYLTVRNWPEFTSSSFHTSSRLNTQDDPLFRFLNLSDFFQLLGRASILFFIITLLVVVRRQQVK